MTEGRFIAINYALVLVFVGLIQVFIQTFSKKGYTLGVSVPKNVKETETMKQILKDYKMMTLTMTIFNWSWPIFCLLPYRVSWHNYTFLFYKYCPFILTSNNLQ